LGSNLYELIKGARITIYKDDALRLAVSRTVAKETPRGMQLTKEKTSHKIDVVIALAMAALHAVEQGAYEQKVADSILVTAPISYFGDHPVYSCDFGLIRIWARRRPALRSGPNIPAAVARASIEAAVGDEQRDCM
jgi:hypothetical protein